MSTHVVPEISSKKDMVLDTGYTRICPVCVRRTGDGVRGVRALEIMVCVRCSSAEGLKESSCQKRGHRTISKTAQLKGYAF